MKTTIATIFLCFVFTLPTGAESTAGEAAEARKPLTTIGAAKTLLNLAERMQRQGMIVEAEAVMSIIPIVLTGTPASQIKPASAVCSTDTECAELERECRVILTR